MGRSAAGTIPAREPVLFSGLLFLDIKPFSNEKDRTENAKNER